MRRRGFTAVELVLVIVVLAIIVSVTLVQVDKRRQVRLRAESRSHLVILNEAFEEGEGYPALSSERGQLAPSEDFVNTVKGFREKKFRPTGAHLFISPALPDAAQMQKDALANPPLAFSDDSYWYLGYALPNEEAGLAFVDAYRKAVEETGKPPTGEIELESPVLVLVGPGRNSLTRTSTLSPLESLEFVGVHNLSGISSPRQFWLKPLFPIFIERPGLQRGGSNVLWGNGRVEFMKYPGEWPMTERFIKALESLDELKVKE